ncbi:MAG: GPW/gp25 family protein [Bacteroidia bacterium]
MWTNENPTELPESQKVPFLGTGWAFPPEFDLTTGKTALTAGDLDIKNSLILLLGTIPGERKVNPQYGVDLSVLLFEILSTSLKTRVTDMIYRAIMKFEPRIDLDEVTYDERPLEGMLMITLYYTIRTTNTRTNLVYPFYLKEGTDL